MISGKTPRSEQIRTAVVLAGGAGLRLRPLTYDMPKSMIPLAGKPIIHWITEWLIRNGISRLVIGVAYKKEMIIQYLESLALPVEFTFNEHTVEGGTGEGFRLAIERHIEDQTFLAMNGDEITNLSVSDFANTHNQNRGVATIAVSALRSPFGVVEINDDTIVAFNEKSILDAYVSTGVYIFDRKILPFLPSSGNVETETFPKLARNGQLKAYKHLGFWGTVNTLKDLHEVESELATGVMLKKQSTNPNRTLRSI